MSFLRVSGGVAGKTVYSELVFWCSVFCVMNDMRMTTTTRQGLVLPIRQVVGGLGILKCKTRAEARFTN